VRLNTRDYLYKLFTLCELLIIFPMWDKNVTRSLSTKTIISFWSTKLSKQWMSKLAGVSSKSPGLGVAPPPTILAQPQTSIHTFFLFSDHRLSLSLSLSLWQSVCSEHANYGPWSFDSVTGKFHGEVEYGREREWSI
jgi:hypothetical protein